jgi:Flp pilus assembly protein TadG
MSIEPRRLEKTMKMFSEHSKGQTIVLFAGMIAALLGATALGTDVAVMYVNHIQMQKAVDEAAIAGANYLSPSNGPAYTYAAPAGSPCAGAAFRDGAQQAACTYAANNGIAVDNNLTITEPTTSTIKVTALKTGLPYYFGGAVGKSTYSISVTATAQTSQSVHQVNKGLFPVGLQCAPTCTPESLVGGESVSFGAKFVGGLANGNWQWLDTGGNGASGIGAAITGGVSGTYTVGGTIDTKPGNNGNSGPVKTAFNDRMAKCSSYGTDPCSGTNPTNILNPGDPCVVVVPIVDFTGCSGKCTLNIEGFAQVYLEPTSTSKNIQGCFVSTIAPDSIGSASAPAFGPLQQPALIL